MSVLGSTCLKSFVTLCRASFWLAKLFDPKVRASLFFTRNMWIWLRSLSLNSVSAQFQTLLTVCQRFAMVRMSELVPVGNKTRPLLSVNHSAKTIHYQTNALSAINLLAPLFLPYLEMPDKQCFQLLGLLRKRKRPTPVFDWRIFQLFTVYFHILAHNNSHFYLY